jgi:hypothetical protein
MVTTGNSSVNLFSTSGQPRKNESIQVIRRGGVTGPIDAFMVPSGAKSRLMQGTGNGVTIRLTATNP